MLPEGGERKRGLTRLAHLLLGPRRTEDLEVGHARAGTIRECDAVAGRHGGVRRLEEHLPGAAGGKQHAWRTQVAQDPLALDLADTDHHTALDQHVGHERVINDAHGG